RTVDVWGGLYGIESMDPEQSVSLVRNEKYWGPPALLDRIVFRVITDPTVQAQALANGEVDVIQNGGAQPAVIGILKKLDDVTFSVVSGLSFEHFDFNFPVPLFPDKAGRHAVAPCPPPPEIVDNPATPTHTP